MIKQWKPEIKALAVEPAKLPVLSRDKPGPHKIQE
jgi:cysteine synthase A